MDQPQQSMNPEDAKASLGLATRLSEHFLLPKVSPDAQIVGDGSQQPQGPEHVVEPEIAEPQPVAEPVPKDDTDKRLQDDEQIRDEIKSVLSQIESILKDEQE